jgi:SAM-dependent methyltransferase
MHCANLLELRQRFIASREFRKVSNLPTSARLPMDSPPLEIDTEAPEEQLAEGIAKIKTAWSHLGIVRPHFSVLTNRMYLPENLEGTLEQFWASGEAEASVVERILARHGVASLGEKICVEFGCGVGRVSIGLARRFRVVYAYDISPTHLANATQRARDMGVDNLVLRQCSDDILEDLQPCDVFYSRIVFQHNPPIVIALLIRKALKSLRAGGIALFQVPTYKAGYRFVTTEWLSSEHPQDMQMHCFPQAKIFELVGKEGCVLLEVREDGAAGEEFLSNMFVVRRPLNRRRLIYDSVIRKLSALADYERWLARFRGAFRWGPMLKRSARPGGL